MSLPPVDQDGYLRDLADWSEAVAVELSRLEGLELDDRHWAVLKIARAFYQRTNVSPEMRPLVRSVKETLGPEQGNSIYLMTLFPDSPAKLVAKIAGLPRPTNCL